MVWTAINSHFFEEKDKKIKREKILNEG